MPGLVIHRHGCPGIRGATCSGNDCTTFDRCSFHLSVPQRQELAAILAIAPPTPAAAALPPLTPGARTKARALRRVPPACSDAFHEALIALLRPFAQGDLALKDTIVLNLIAFPAARLPKPTGNQQTRLRAIKASLVLGGSPSPAPHPRAPPPPPDPEEAQLRRVRKGVREGYVGRAARVLWRPLEGLTIPLPQLASLLGVLHPKETPCGDIVTQGPSALALDAAELQSWSKRCCKGGASDIHGWSDELLAQALENPEVAALFVPVILHIANNQCGPRVREALSDCILIGIPKGSTADKGVRPIAIMSILLKFTSGFFASKLVNAINLILRPTQLGVGTPGGAETIVHRLRKALDADPDVVVCTIDFKNAFNALLRSKMKTALASHGTLASLWSLFNLAYSSPSALHVFGDGSSSRVESARGCRQGDPLGALLFCLALQPILVEATSKFSTKGVTIFAYMDDVSIVGHPKAVAECFEFIVAKAKELGLEENASKCQWFGNSASRPKMPKRIAFVDRLECIKILGAWIGTDAAVLLQLQEELRTGTQHVEKLKKLDGHEALLVLLKSLVPRWNFILRSHPPSVTDDFASDADSVLLAALTFLADVKISQNANMLRSLPTRLGGLGLLSTSVIRSAAYDSSREASEVDLTLAHADYLKALGAIESQAARTEVLHEAVLAKLCQDPELRLLIEDAATSSSSCWLRSLPQCAAPLNHAEVGAALRLRLGLKHALVDSKCPGCGMELSLTRFSAHISGCVRIKGANASSAHADMKRGLRSIARFCGVSHDPHEPSQYDLPKGRSLSGETRIIRPDMRFRPSEGTPIVIDCSLTSGVLAAANTKGLQAILTREQQKDAMYKGLVEANDERFLPLVVTALGSLTNTSSILWTALAHEYRRLTTVEVRNEIAFCAVRARARSTLAAEEKLGAPHQALSIIRSPDSALPHFNEYLEAAFLAPTDTNATACIDDIFIRPSLTLSQRALGFIQRNSPIRLPQPTFSQVAARIHVDHSDDPSHIPPVSRRARLWSFIPRPRPRHLCYISGLVLLVSLLLPHTMTPAELEDLISSIAPNAYSLGCYTLYLLGNTLAMVVDLLQVGAPVLLNWCIVCATNFYVIISLLVSLTLWYLHWQRKLADVLARGLLIAAIAFALWFLADYVMALYINLPYRIAGEFFSRVSSGLGSLFARSTPEPAPVSLFNFQHLNYPQAALPPTPPSGVWHDIWLVFRIPSADEPLWNNDQIESWLHPASMIN